MSVLSSILGGSDNSDYVYTPDNDPRIHILHGFKFDSVEYNSKGDIVVTHTVKGYTVTWNVAANGTVAEMLKNLKVYLRSISDLLTTAE